MKNFYSNFLKSEFIRNTILLLSGTVVAQIIVLLSYPFLTRFFSPTEFGLLAVYTNVVNSLQILIAGRYDLAIILPKKERDSKSLILLSLYIGLILLFIFYLIIYFFENSIIQFLKNDNIHFWIYITPISIYFILIFQITNYWLIRHNAFKKSSYLKIIQTLSISFISLILGFLCIKDGLIIGYIIGNILMIYYSIYLLIKTDFFKIKTTTKRLIRNMIIYKDYPIYNLFPSFANTLSSTIPIFYINNFYGDQIVGYVNLAKQLILIPISFISNSFSQVYFVTIVKKINENKKIFNDFIKNIKILSIIALLFFIITSSTSFWIFKYIFGTKWEEAGLYASILSFSASISFVVSSLSVVCIALNKIRIYSIWQIFYFLSICSLYFAKFLSPLNFFILYVVIDSIVYFINFAIIYNIVKKYDSKIKINSKI